VQLHLYNAQIPGDSRADHDFQSIQSRSLNPQAGEVDRVGDGQWSAYCDHFVIIVFG
jgi:hypothetical protein